MNRPLPAAVTAMTAMTAVTAGTLRLSAVADSSLALEGPLTFATARSAHELGTRLLSRGGAGALEIDCSAVTVADSAGLAVLLDWMRTAKSAGRPLRYAHLPAGLTALARISEVEELLARGV
jgi:phospholipid transport system transporter-binding protein